MTGILAEPSFIDRDAQAVTAEMVARYEAVSGKTLFPAQPERILLDQVAYRETLIRIAIQEAARQNLARYARYPMLDYLGELTGVKRLPAQAARVQLSFSRTDTSLTLAIPAGTQVHSADGSIAFATSTDAYIQGGETSVTVWSDATVAGAALNGITSGQLTVIVAPPAGDVTAQNITTSYGGSDAETDDRFRQRVMLAPERDAGGTLTAYRLAALSTHPDIVDVAVTSDTPGSVTVSASTATGAPDEGLLDLLRTALGAEDFKPLTDQVTVIAPRRVAYAVDLRLTLYPGAGDAAGAVRAAVEVYAAVLRKTLGADLVPSRFIALAQNVAGVQAVTLAAPAATVLGSHDYADCTGIGISVSGVSNG